MAQNIYPSRIQVLAIIGSILFLIFIIELIRKRKIKEEYGLLWIFFSLVFIVISRLSEHYKALNQQMGILRLELKELNDRVARLDDEKRRKESH